MGVALALPPPVALVEQGLHEVMGAHGREAQGVWQPKKGQKRQPVWGVL